MRGTGYTKGEQKRELVINLRISPLELALIDEISALRKRRYKLEWSRIDVIMMAIRHSQEMLGLEKKED